MVVATIDNCPICDGAIPSEREAGKYPGALSRYDNKTEICSNCGVTEALFEWSVKSYRSACNNKTYTWEDWKIIMTGEEE